MSNSNYCYHEGHNQKESSQDLLMSTFKTNFLKILASQNIFSATYPAQNLTQAFYSIQTQTINKNTLNRKNADQLNLQLTELNTTAELSCKTISIRWQELNAKVSSMPNFIFTKARHKQTAFTKPFSSYSLPQRSLTPDLELNIPHLLTSFLSMNGLC